MNATQDSKRSEMLQVRVRPGEAVELRVLAKQGDEPVSAVVRRAIRRYIEQEGGKG